LERLRFAKVQPHIPKGARLLDVGTGDGTFLRILDTHIQAGIGIDPILTAPLKLTETSCLLLGTVNVFGKHWRKLVENRRICPKKTIFCHF